jgi:Ser/Thr protein kinase RdoA (MazF antagonist)
MQQLSNNGVSTSDPQPSNDGGLPLATSDLPVVSEAHSPCPLIVKLLTWVPGRTMSSLKALPIECLLDAGKYLGKMHVALDKMDPSKHPASQRFHAWDGKNTAHVRDWVSAIDTPKRRSMVESVIGTFETDILKSGVGDKFRKGINQGDFNDANILVDEDFQVSGAIDFGDSTERYVRSSFEFLFLSFVFVCMCLHTIIVYACQN